MERREGASAMTSRHIGPNVRKLIASKMAREAIPDKGGFSDGLKFLSQRS